jgi:hypothetical protein
MRAFEALSERSIRTIATADHLSAIAVGQEYFRERGGRR